MADAAFRTALPTGSTWGSTCDMALSDWRMAAPMAVPGLVLRLPMARSRTARSLVGATASSAKPEKATRPIRVPLGWELTNSRAPFSAALNRSGYTSVEHMEPDSSRARMMVVCDSGTSVVTWGRADATASTARLTKSRAMGTWRRQRERRGTAARSRDKLEYVTACGRRRRCALT